MKSVMCRVGKCVGLGVLCCVMAVNLVACGPSKVDQTHYAKIQKNMSKEAVYSILGQPTKETSMNVAGLTGTNNVWVAGKRTITVQFVNGKVVMSAFDDGTDGDQ